MTKLVFDSLTKAERSFAVLDLITDTHAWVKNRRGIFVYGNILFYKRFGDRPSSARNKSAANRAENCTSKKTMAPSELDGPTYHKVLNIFLGIIQ